MGNWLVNHWFSATVLVSVWGWGGPSARRGGDDVGGYGGHGLGMAPGGSWGKWGLRGCPGAGLQGGPSIPSAPPTCKAPAARGGMGFRKLKENTTQRKGGGILLQDLNHCCFAWPLWPGASHVPLLPT